MSPSPESLKKRERFLTREYYDELAKDLNDQPTDPFTGTHPPPNAFRIGRCSATAEEAGFELQLFWRSDEVSTQKEIDISLAKVGDQWLLKRVGSLF